MYRYELQNWWTFKEVLDILDEGSNLPWAMQDNFEGEFHSMFSGAPVWKNASAALDYIEDLWSLLFARYYDDYVLYNYDDEDGEEVEPTTDEIRAFFAKLINVIVLTYPKYSVLLKSYQTKENGLLDQIASNTTGVARFNDTPQNVEDGGADFEDDNHVTNITSTKGTSLTDGMTPIERLKQIQEGYKSVMRDWCNEFKILFINGENISI